ncbi:MAG: DoxX family protein [Alphaproteobacteria bacterium]
MGRSIAALLDRIPHGLIALCARFGVGAVFWMSGQTKVEGWRISETTYTLFAEEYKVPFVPPDWAAVMATISEHLFPALLFVGLFTRLSAAALLGMTAVIQIFVYPDAWPTHLTWATCFIYLIARGAGAASLDHLLFRAGR